MTLPLITDEKLEEYLTIWKRHIEQGRNESLDFTLNMSFHFDCPYSLTFGEEKRELTFAQVVRFYETFTPLVEKFGIKK